MVNVRQHLGFLDIFATSAPHGQPRQFYARRMRCLPNNQISPQRCLNSWHTALEREGFGPFTPLTPIWITAVSLFSVAGTGVAQGCVGGGWSLCLLRLSSRSLAPRALPSPPTNKLPHTGTWQLKQKITSTGWRRMPHTGTKPPKQTNTSTSRRLKQSVPSARPDRESYCRAIRRVRPIPHRRCSCRPVSPR